jgi:hypothetical protein
LKSDPHPEQPSPYRRKLLWGVPATLVAAQGCGGGSSAAAATAPAPASGTPTPALTPSLSATTSWPSRPSPAAVIGQGLFVPDVGIGGSLWYSIGTAWVPLSNPLTLAHRFSNARMDASVGANADVLLDSQTIPAYVLGPSSALRITAAFSVPGNGVAAKAPQVRAWFGSGSYASSSTPLLDTRGQFSTQKSLLLIVTLQNRNSMSVNQIRPIDYSIGASGNAFATSAIDFSQDVTIGFGALNHSTSLSSDDRQVLDWFSIEMIA